MSFDTEVQNNQFQVNVVIKIGDDYYSQYQPDSGLVVDSENVGLLSRTRISGNAVDIRDVRTTVASLSFNLLDENGLVTSRIMSDDSNFLEKTCIIYVGFITGSFDFSNYNEFSTTKIKSINKKDNEYSFSCSEITSLLQGEIYTTLTTLVGSINETETTIELEDASQLPSSGEIIIDSEYISYTGITINTLTGVIRNINGGDSESHISGSEVFLTTTIEDNPIDILIDIMENQLGIDSSDIDIATFEYIRDNKLEPQSYRFNNLYNISNAVKFMEDEILQSTFTRFIMKNGKISLAIFDTLDIDETLPEMNEEEIIGNPRWGIGSNKIVNSIEIHWGYDVSAGKFTRISNFTDSESSSAFGDKKKIIYKFKGIKSDLDGSTIVSSTGNRLLARLSTTQNNIEATTFLSTSYLEVGDDVSVTHRYLPQQGGGLGMAGSRLEIMSMAPDFENGRVRYTLQPTSFSNIRIAYISPVSLLSSIVDQSTFSVDDGSCYKVGYSLQLFDTVLNSYIGEDSVIVGINGNELTVSPPFVTTLTSTIAVHFSDYGSTSSIQNGNFGSIGENSGIFDDGVKVYEIYF